MADEMQQQLQAYLNRTFPAQQTIQVINLIAVSNGWENEVYTFTVESGPPADRRREKRVLRIYPGDGAYRTSKREFEGMQKLFQAGYPVPQVFHLEHDQSPFGRPFIIMEWIDGAMLWPLLFESSEAGQRPLLTQFCQLLLQLHRLDWRAFAPDTAQAAADDPYFFVDQILIQFQERQDHFAAPEFAPVLTWLAAQRDDVPCLNPGPVHLDFHPGNVLIRPDGSAIVIDWTQVQVSDPRVDLVWTLLLAASHENRLWRDRILHEYERLAGSEVAQIEYFEVMACLKRLFSVVVSLRDGPERLSMRPEAVTAMRQQMGALRRVYEIMIEKTGLHLPEVAAVLTET